MNKEKEYYDSMRAELREQSMSRSMSRKNDNIIREALRELNEAVEFLESIETLDEHHAREVIENCRRAADHMLKAVDIVETAYVGNESRISEGEEDSG